MCLFLAIGVKEEFVSSLNIIGEYWECKNASIIKINSLLKWNWVIDFDAQCACKLFTITKNKNNFIKMEMLVRIAHSCIIVNHFYSSDQNEEKLVLSPIKILNIDIFMEINSLDQDIPLKLIVPG